MNARKILFGVVLVVVAVNLALVAVVLMGTASPPPAAMSVPKPNGYDDFVHAEKLLTSKVDDYKALTPEKLRDLVTANTAAMALVRTGLGRESVVPLDDLKWKHEEHLAQLTDFKLLTLAFSAEAAAAELGHRFDDAATIWLEALQFSHSAAHGGAYIDAAVCWQDENFALTHMLKMTNALDARACTRVAKAIEELDFRAESPEQILTQDKVYTGKLTFHESFRRVIHFKKVKQLKEDFLAKYNAEVKQRRETMVTFAARAHELEKGKAPTSLNDLVPTYLKDVPKNPGTVTNLDYTF
jgi:hypothetical protein